MGRYYDGDIEGKFWFGVQSSDDGEFFGAEEDTSYTNYYAEDIKKADDGVNKCLKELGDYKEKIDQFFKEHDSYNNEMLEEYLKLGKETTRNLLTWYARLDLGLKIQKCIKEDGSCSFNAEN